VSLKRDLAEQIAKEARLYILRELAEQTNGRLSASLLKRVLDAHEIHRDRDWIETQLEKLEALGAISIIHAGTMPIAVIERVGLDHLEQRAVISGIARPRDVE